MWLFVKAVELLPPPPPPPPKKSKSTEKHDAENSTKRKKDSVWRKLKYEKFCHIHEFTQKVEVNICGQKGQTSLCGIPLPYTKVARCTGKISSKRKNAAILSTASMSKSLLALGFGEKSQRHFIFNNNRWPPGFRIWWPSGPPTSETRWPFRKSGGQWPPGHREFRAL